jgi:hypothetical protein
VVRVLGGVGVALAQAAVGAILVISSANVDVGPQRLLDALDLLGGSCLMLVRTADAVDSGDRPRIAASVRELADILRALAGDLGDQATRQTAADRSLEVAPSLPGDADDAQSRLAAAVMSARMVSADVMVFAGVDAQQAMPQRVRAPASSVCPHQ